jgi:transposase-like protein
MAKQICPVCESENIILDAGGNTGKYSCKDCNYIGVLILEKTKKQDSCASL